jgi:dTDP-3-amino-3,4,6-trideoxy-alpha-D-glucose transaminase
MDQVQFLDFRAASDELETETNAAIRDVLDGGMYILGEEVAAFEREFAEFYDVRHCNGVGNGQPDATE